MSTVDELRNKGNRISSNLDDLETLYIDDVYNQLPETFEAIVLSGIPEQSNSWKGTDASAASLAEVNDNRYYFVRVRPLGIQDLIIPDPFMSDDMDTAKKLINAHPLGYIEVINTVHPPTHGDVFECRYLTKNRLGISLVRRLRNSNKKISGISNRNLHTVFNPDKNPQLMANYGKGPEGNYGGTMDTPSGEHPYRDMVFQGSHFPGDKIRTNKKIKPNKYITGEYIPARDRVLAGDPLGLKLLATVMAIKEGFYPRYAKSNYTSESTGKKFKKGDLNGTRSYYHNNPGNIGNTDSGGNRTYATLDDGIRKQKSYIQSVANGTHKYYPLGKKKNIKPYYSKEIARNQKTYKKSPYVPGYQFTYTGQIDQFVKIYATGARSGNSYLSMIISWFKQEAGIVLTPQSKIQDIIKMTG
jgi:hypothetical protein